MNGTNQVRVRYVKRDMRLLFQVNMAADDGWHDVGEIIPMLLSVSGLLQIYF